MNAGFAALVFLAFGLVGCKSVTELVVRVDSDLAPGSSFVTPSGAQVRFSGLRFKLEMLQFGTEIDQLEPEPVFKEYVALLSSENPGGAPLPVELGVVARGDWHERVLGVEVRGQASEGDLTDDNGTAFFFTRVQARFVAGEVGLLPVHLFSSCSLDAHPTIGKCNGNERCVPAATGPSLACEAIPIEEKPSPYVALTGPSR